MKSLKGGLFFSVLFSVILLLTGAAQSEEKILFRHKFEEGKSYYVKQVTEQKTTTVVDGKEQVQEKIIALGFNFNITEIDFDGNAWVSCEYDWTKIYAKNAQSEVSFDSSKETLTVHPAVVGYKLMVGRSFYLNITPQGKVKKVNGLNTIRSYIKNAIPSGPMREKTLASMAALLAEEGVKRLFENFMAIFPEKEVGVGQYWDRTLSLSTKDSKSIHKKRWTLKSRKDGVSLIEFESTLKPEPLKMSKEQRGEQVRYEMSGTNRGWIKVEESTGRIIRSEIVEDVVSEYKSIVDGKRIVGAPLVKLHTVKIREMTRIKKPVVN